MLKAYLNYPNSRVTAHFDPDCSNIQPHRKSGQRHTRIDIATVSEVLTNFRNGVYAFAANPERNDMWLEISFGDPEFEQAVLTHICGLLGMHYSRFAGVRQTVHCTS